MLFLQTCWFLPVSPYLQSHRTYLQPLLLPCHLHSLWNCFGRSLAWLPLVSLYPTRPTLLLHSHKQTLSVYQGKFEVSFEFAGYVCNYFNDGFLLLWSKQHEEIVEKLHLSWSHWDWLISSNFDGILQRNTRFCKPIHPRARKKKESGLWIL